MDQSKFIDGSDGQAASGPLEEDAIQDSASAAAREGAARASTLTIQLSFEPAGPGRLDDPYYSCPLRNCCVVCGVEGAGGDQQPPGGLLKQQLIPREYRVWFHESYKSHSSHDIVSLCRACHDRYGKPMSDLKRQLLLEHGLPVADKACGGGGGGDGGATALEDGTLTQATKAINALRNHGAAIPRERVLHLKGKLIELLQFSVDPATTPVARLLELAAETMVARQAAHRQQAAAAPQQKAPGQVVAQAVLEAGQLQAFVNRWRAHFVAVMAPMHMPAGWSPTRAIGDSP